MIKEEYECIEMEIIQLQNQDIIQTSQQSYEEDELVIKHLLDHNQNRS